MKKAYLLILCCTLLLLISCTSADLDDNDIQMSFESTTEPQNLSFNEYIKKYISGNELDYFGKELPLLSSIPERDIYLYGRNIDNRNDGENLLLKYGNKFQTYQWSYFSPQLRNPSLYLNDFDSDGANEVAIRTSAGSGTGVSVWDLHIVRINDEAELYDNIFYKFKTASVTWLDVFYHLNERITNGEAYFKNYAYVVDVFIDGKEYTIDISELKIRNGKDSEFTDISLWYAVDFEVKNNSIRICAPLGYCHANAVMPDYGDEYIYAEVLYDGERISIGDIWVE